MNGNICYNIKENSIKGECCMEFSELIKQRYSVRKFSPKAIEPEKLSAILEAGRLAPTAKNMQPQRIYVLQSKDALEKANNLSPCIYGAQTVLMICADVNEAWHRLGSGVSAAETDASIVATHMMLAAKNEGIGSVWVGMFVQKEAQKVFGLPENIMPYALMPIGYADMGPSERHEDRKPLNDTVIVL